MEIWVEKLIYLAGWGQLVLVLGSLAIPKVLGWSEDTSKLRPLTRQVFWTYAGYIWATNLSFAILSIAEPGCLIEGSFLALSVSLYITLYWVARIVIQFTYFDRSDAPSGLRFALAEFFLVLLFVGLSGVYGAAFYLNLMGS